MRQIGLFEAKTKLSEICEEVARSGQGVVVTRRGKPLVRIEPVPTDRFSVWEDRERYVVQRGRLKDEFELPVRSTEVPTSPLDD